MEICHMIRKSLLAGIAVLALAAPAHAQIPVTDGGLISQGWEELANWATELESWAKQLTAMQQQLQTMLGLYNAVTHAPNVAAGLETALGYLGLTNALPVNPWAVQQLISGNNTNFAGIGAAISGLVNQSWASNHVYTPTTGSFADQQMIAKANGLAGTQGLASQLYQSISEERPILQQLHDAILAAPDLKDVADLQARYQLVATDMQSKVAQFQTVQQMAATQQAVWQQQADEQDSKNIDAFIAEGAARGY
jgi:hypothetical protein